MMMISSVVLQVPGAVAPPLLRPTNFLSFITFQAMYCILRDHELHTFES